MRDRADYVKGLRARFSIQRGPGGKQVTTSTCGCCLMEQNCYAIAAFRRFFKTEKEIKRVIELGTGRGGFSYFLNEECKKYDTEFSTFETEPHKCTACEKHGFVSELTSKDADPNYLGDIIKREGRTILLVDSAKKNADVAKYVKFLKPNDVVMVHDYAHDRSFYHSVMRAKNIWRSCGTQLKHMSGTHDSLEKYRPMLFWRAAWGAFVKK